MKHQITEKRRLTLVGIDFYGNPFADGEAFSMDNTIGQIWQRFNTFYEKKKNYIKHLVSDAGYELWIDFEGDNERNKYIFVGVAIAKLEEVPLELVARLLPETRYAIFTLKDEEMTSDWPSRILDWVTESGLKQSYTYIIEYYDPQRFKGMGKPESELDIYVPVL
jgi:predicted transcriptional regulator YdeE